MSNFQFRLATLLRLREVTRDERRLQLAEVQRTDAELEGELARLDIEQTQLQQECRTAAAPGAVDLGRVLGAQQYASTLRAAATELKQQRRSLAVEIDRRREALLAADRDVRSLEKLCQRDLQARRQNEVRQEAKRLDEAALQVVRT